MFTAFLPSAIEWVSMHFFRGSLEMDIISTLVGVNFTRDRYRRVNIVRVFSITKSVVNPPTSVRWTIRPIKIRVVEPSTQWLATSFSATARVSVVLRVGPLIVATSLDTRCSPVALSFSWG